MYPYIDVFRVRVVRGTRWTCAATLLPSRCCWSTGIQPLQCQWSSLCHLLRSSARLHPVLLLACRGFRSHCVVTPPPPPSPPVTGARTLSAQTTRWRCQSTMKCWLRLAPHLMHRQVKIRTFFLVLVIQYYCLFSGAPSGYLENLDQVLVYFNRFRVSSNVTSLPVWAAEKHPHSSTLPLLCFSVADGKGQVSSIKSVGQLSIWPLYPMLVESCSDELSGTFLHHTRDFWISARKPLGFFSPNLPLGSHGQRWEKPWLHQTPSISGWWWNLQWSRMFFSPSSYLFLDTFLSLRSGGSWVVVWVWFLLSPMSQAHDAWKRQTFRGCTLTFSSLSLTLAAEYESQAAASLEQLQMNLAGQEFQSELVMESFLKLNSAGDHLKEAREGESPLNRLLSTCSHWWFWSQAASVIVNISPPHLYSWWSYIVLVGDSEHFFHF